jgi:acetyl/propionyl-CoA carboxylase alpha subunit
MKRSLAEFTIAGVQTTIPFCQFVLSHRKFLTGEYDTGFVSTYYRPEAMFREGNLALVAAAIMAAREKGRSKNTGTALDGGRERNSSPWKKKRFDTYR